MTNFDDLRYDPDDEIERHRLTLEGLLELGGARLTAISAHGIIGIDDVFYKWNGVDEFKELLDEELAEIETGIVVNRMDRFVSFQSYVQPPLSWPGLVYALDELTSKVLLEVGSAIGLLQERRVRVRLTGDLTDSWVIVDAIANRFWYQPGGGYTPRWLKGTRASVGFK